MVGLTTFVRDPNTLKGAKVNSEGALSVIRHSHPTLDDNVVLRPHRDNFLNSVGAIQMNVDGSVAAVEYCIEAVSEFDTFIKTISIEITDTNPSLRLFGALPRLTNGVSFIWRAQAAGDEVVLSTFRSNFEFVRLGQSSTPGWGSGTSAMILPNATAINDDSYLITIDFAVVLGMEFGLRLEKGTLDRLIFRVQDDLTGLTSFTAIAGGTQL